MYYTIATYKLLWILLVSAENSSGVNSISELENGKMEPRASKLITLSYKNNVTIYIFLRPI